MIILQRMTETEFQDYLPYCIEEYGRDLSTNHGYPLETGIINASKSIHGYLPTGLATLNNLLMCIKPEREPDQIAGYLWVNTQDRDNAYICDFCVLPAWQRRGFATAALTALEQLLREQGFNGLSLRVAADNPSALALYKKTDFRVTGINMSKQLTQ